MVVDDDTMYLDQIKYFLTQREYEVYATTDPKKALTQLSSFSPDVLVLDWVFTDCSGIDVLKTIREKVQNQWLYVIMLSGKIMTEDIVYAFTSGCNDYVIKPFTEDELCARILNGVQSSHIARAEMAKRELLQSDIKKLNAICSQLPGLITKGPASLTVMQELKDIVTNLQTKIR